MDRYFLSEIGVKGQGDGISKNLTVCRLTSDTGNLKVQVFELSGSYLTIFVSFGNGIFIG